MSITTTASSLEPVINQINALLPQTQCGQCGYKGCKPYAEAIAMGNAEINQCPPGGEEGIKELALLLNREAKSLNPLFGIHKGQQVAFIVEEDCIGCVKCIAACPVDAILGAAKLMHTVITGECTGCELCIAPCPVDCIVMKPIPTLLTTAQKKAQRLKAKYRYEKRHQRKENEALEKAEKSRKQKEALLNAQASTSTHPFPG